MRACLAHASSADRQALEGGMPVWRDVAEPKVECRWYSIHFFHCVVYGMLRTRVSPQPGESLVGPVHYKWKSIDDDNCRRHCAR